MGMGLISALSGAVRSTKRRVARLIPVAEGRGARFHELFRHEVVGVPSGRLMAEQSGVSRQVQRRLEFRSTFAAVTELHDVPRRNRRRIARNRLRNCGLRMGPWDK
jgi:hypothetical protein